MTELIMYILQMILSVIWQGLFGGTDSILSSLL
jgi:hypothetical protein